jgi:molybdopterin molybdotransferase
LNGPRERGRPGEDAADRAFDDALALANGPRAAAARPPAANDPLAVALGHEPAHPGDPAPGSGKPREPQEPHDRPSPPSPHEAPAAARTPLPWPRARQIARQARPRLGARSLPLGDDVLGMALARPLTALTDLPSFDSSAMDGWAVAGPGPWRIRPDAGVLAGRSTPAEALHSGHAVRIATGAVLPPGTTAVVRSERGTVGSRTDGEWLRVAPPHPEPRAGQEMRRRGQECRGGDELLPAGTLVTPAVLGLAAAAGHDGLSVVMRPRVEVLVLGDELLDQGPPRAGRVRDALGPMLPSWLRGLGAEVTAVHRLKDDADLLYAALRACSADLVVTTGGTAGGPVDHVHPVLARLGARLLVDGVAVRPGHPMLLAELPAGPLLAGLPGNPLAAVSGVLTLVAPALGSLAGRPVPAPYAAPLTADVTGHPADTRLVPVVFDDESAARPLHFSGPAMLRGLAAADGMAVIPPGGARAGQETAVLDTGAPAPAWGSGG